ncbi:hypothetical protein PNOK_0933000 [Pyrrhoderma noxium]|uniref:Extracellular membrane protein CFEM domain-containing protein n=1 Tax=Pyrrhoderma noxium TaxID=2282107 RepID=A0A286U5C9_9AGAM|nr:hypothetical protein PNOK_0933000 [Pyrrhoderma noxium]
MYSSRVFALLALLIIQVSALSSSPANIFARQSLDPSAIPEACTPTCAPIMATVASCSELSCLCNNDVAKQIADCADCLVAVSNDSSVLSQEQTIVDQYNNACATSGQPISSVQVSSVAPSSGSSGSATSTSTGTGSGTESNSATSTSTSTSESNQGNNAAAGRTAHIGVGASAVAGLAVILLA